MVDDEASIRTLLSNHFTNQGHEVVTAKDGREALEVLNTATFDRIYLDLMMPYLDGWEAVRLLRKDARHRLTWVGVMTAQAASISEHVEESFAPGSFVSKPIILKDLLE